MEAAKIDWKSIESVFVMDQVYENINAPQWVDFLASSSSSSSPEDDVAWFCRSDCKHPRTAEDFLKSTPTSKLLRSVSVSKLIADWTRREATNLKRRGVTNQIPSVVNEEDSENRNPNYSTPPNHNQIKYNNNNKEVIKSSAHKEDEYIEILLDSDEKPRLKATLSAKDLFGGTGKDLFGKITDFCNELKKMAASSRAKDDKVDVQHIQPLNPSHTPLEPKVVEEREKEPNKANVLGPRLEKMNEKDKERKPFLEVKLEAGDRINGKSKLCKNKLRGEDAENIPVSLDLSNIKRNGKIPTIRMNPPTPQGFSATRDPIKATPSKAPKSRLLEREVVEEVEQKKKTLREELGSGNASLVGVKEGRALDVFWFLKPCTLSS